MKKIILPITFILITVSVVQAQESKFKALFIYKFSEYITWPSGGSQVTIGVLGDTPVYNELAKIAQSKSDLSIIKLSSLSKLSECQIIYLPGNRSKSASSIQSQIGSRSILLVADDKSTTGEGSDIGFFLQGGKLRFLIHESGIRKKRMIPNSKLLALGQTI